jgi:hypothetical protein
MAAVKLVAVAHFADHDDVGVLAQDVLETFLEGKGVQADFALFDDGLVVFEDVFDGVFEGDDVLAAVGVDVFDHGGEGGGFAAAGGAGEQDDAARAFGDLPQLGQQAQFLEGGHLGFDVAHGQAILAALMEAVGAEPPDAGHEIGEIHLAQLLDVGLVMAGEDVVDHRFHPFFRRVGAFHHHQFPVDAKDNGAADFQVNVGRAALDGRGENLAESIHARRLAAGRDESQPGKSGP